MEALPSDGSEIPKSLSPDELCLQPMKSYPGFSQVCNLCIQVFREREKDKWKAHVELLSTLEESAKRGCRLCNLIFERSKEDVQGKAITRISLRYMAYYGSQSVRFQSLSLQRNYSITCENIEASHYISTSKQRIAGNTSSESNKFMARWWFQRCSNNHPHCRPVRYSAREVPKRLLEVGISPNGPTVKVIETQPLQDIEYMTLGHCWGGSLPLRLLTANLEASKTSIPFSSLPQTFQDAFSVVGWFGIKYLWIDALCIIQDSDEDWAHESDRMRDYYKYSFGTIAATGASNSSEGLFFDRNPAFVPPFRAIISWEGEERDVAVTAGGSCLAYLQKQPLNQRGWFLQERFLSPRILHFGSDHMSWECQTEVSCETWPNIVPSPVYSRSSYALNSDQTSMSRDLRKLTSIRHLWRELVFTYSRMALTRLSDKCVAFAGVAEELQATTRDDYVAGLWRRDLAEELLWRLDMNFGEHQYPKESSARPQLYLAPSWSWLSINRAVKLPDFGRLLIMKMIVINAKVEGITGNEFGAIKHGVISARGALVRVICLGGHAPWCFHSIGSARIGRRFCWYSIYIDEGYIEDPDMPTYCLPILEDGPDNSDHDQLHGLLVVPTLKMTAQYRRIGTFQMAKAQAYDLLEVPGALNDGLNGTGFQSFTLV